MPVGLGRSRVTSNFGLSESLPIELSYWVASHLYGVAAEQQAFNRKHSSRTGRSICAANFWGKFSTLINSRTSAKSLSRSGAVESF
jgi:hypothetical protein